MIISYCSKLCYIIVHLHVFSALRGGQAAPETARVQLRPPERTRPAGDPFPAPHVYGGPHAKAHLCWTALQAPHVQGE